MTGNRLSKPKMKNVFGLVAVTFMVTILLSSVYTQSSFAGEKGNGNPQPGFPHDTLVIHIQQNGTGSGDCSGGHSAHIGADLEKGRVTAPLPAVQMKIMMVDWVDEDGDPSDGVNDEPYSTKFVDCDTRLDPQGEETLILQIGDKDPRKDWITTQSWFIRMVGIPDQAFALETPSGTFTTCDLDDKGTEETDDDEFVCSETTIDLNDIDLSGTGCVKTVKKNGQGNGKTVFCDITSSFLVDVDTDLNGTYDCRDGDDPEDVDLCGVHIFAIGCEDPDPTTEEHELAELCPLGSALWTFNEETQRPTIQIFVSHDGEHKVTKGKGGHVEKHQKS